MNIVRRVVKSTLLVMLGVALGLGMSISTIAKNNTTVKKNNVNGVLYEIVYADLSPKVQLVKYYANGDLQNIRLHNKGKPIQAHVNHEKYTLRTNDKVDIDMPNLTAFFVEIRPMPARVGHKALYSPVGKMFLVEVPEQTNTTYQKTHQYTPPKPKK